MRHFLRAWLQSFKKVQIWLKTIFFNKSKKVSKNAEFHADFKSVEKVLKNAPKKVLSKTSLTTWVKVDIFAKKFYFVNFFTTFSTDLKSGWKIGHISTFSNFEDKRAKKAQKDGKPFFYKHVLEFNYATINGLVHPSC